VKKIEFDDKINYDSFFNSLYSCNMKKVLALLLLSIFSSCENYQKAPAPLKYRSFIRYGGEPIIEYQIFLEDIDELDPNNANLSTKIVLKNISSYNIDSCLIIINAYENEKYIIENNIARYILNIDDLALNDSISFSYPYQNSLWYLYDKMFEQEFINIKFTLGGTSYNNRNGIYNGKYVTYSTTDTSINNIKNCLTILTADDRFITRISGNQDVKIITGDIYNNNFLSVALSKNQEELSSLTQDSFSLENDTLFLRFNLNNLNNTDSINTIELTLIKSNAI